jgi:MerR family transcriptional regulator, Zn(II)-responsive regulator of zntA
LTQLKAAEVAARVGVLPSTIQYYRKLGLLRPAGRTQGGFWLFDEAAVKKAQEIRRLQKEQRLTLDEIADRFQGVA